LRCGVALLHALCKLDLLRGGEQRKATRPVHEQTECVGGHEHLVVVGISCGGRGDLDVPLLELRPDRDDFLVVEVVFGRESVEQAFVNGAALLGVVKEGAHRCFKCVRSQFSSLLRRFVRWVKAQAKPAPTRLAYIKTLHVPPLFRQQLL